MVESTDALAGAGSISGAHSSFARAFVLALLFCTETTYLHVQYMDPSVHTLPLVLRNRCLPSLARKVQQRNCLMGVHYYCNHFVVSLVIQLATLACGSSVASIDDLRGSEATGTVCAPNTARSSNTRTSFGLLIRRTQRINSQEVGGRGGMGMQSMESIPSNGMRLPSIQVRCVSY